MTTPNPPAATTATTTTTKRKRVSTYSVKIVAKFYDHSDEPQACVDKRKKLELLAKELGFSEIDGSGFFSSTMMDVPK